MKERAKVHKTQKERTKYMPSKRLYSESGLGDSSTNQIGAPDKRIKDDKGRMMPHLSHN